ncbi:MAG TPA: Type 1 glutamine amidotransferase-like domain-containing protein [Candidatus Cloacimonadota bacterium]|nr:Type 1 glutamine amidotransferase-like domain-containing protein [Candidatus Cloacimonadota bacterium]
MRRLYLISDLTTSFQEFSRKYVEVCGGKKAHIAFLMQGGKEWQKYFAIYEDSFRRSNPTDFFPVFPDDDFHFEPEMLDKLAAATGIFVGGGHAFRYIKAYAESPLAEVIRSKYMAGIPYAGLSAGAIITTRLGFLPDFAIKPHFTAKKRFNELIAKMNYDHKEIGLGLDDGIWVEIEDDNRFTFYGDGNCYFFRYCKDHKFELEIFSAGMTIIL